MQEQRLRNISPSQAAWYSSAESTTGALKRDGCTSNTRVKVLEQLRCWAYDGSAEAIYWLNGMAGTGKTTIAYSLCDKLDRAFTLAASFFCSRQLPACRDVNLIFPTIAYRLARFSPPFRYALSAILEQSPDVHTQRLSNQFEKLILEPLREVANTLSADLVVIIDALDECENKDGVSQLLNTLILNAPDLPIKFFVTSRPESKILDQMGSPVAECTRLELRLHDLEQSMVEEDIRTYLSIKLEPMSLSDDELEQLVKLSGVLFIYASTLVRYIGADNFSKSPRRRLSAVLAGSNSRSQSSHKDIDGLYTTILAAAFDDQDQDTIDRQEMKLVLDTIICAQEPLEVRGIAGLLKLEDEGAVRSALRSLLSVLHFSESTGVVTTLHASFPDYMLNKDRSNKFHCDAQEHNQRLAQLCFDMMKTPDPPFNICSLDSSYLFDKDVPGLEEIIRKTISPELFYACQYWPTHLMLSNAPVNLAGEIYEFQSTRLLLWMEIMNLKQAIHAGAAALYRVYTFYQVGVLKSQRTLGNMID